MPEPQTSSQEPTRSKLPRNDEWLALIVAFGAIGGIMVYTMRDSSGGLLALMNLGDRVKISVQVSGSDSDRSNVDSTDAQRVLDRTAQQMELTLQGFGRLGGTGLVISETSRSQTALPNAAHSQTNQNSTAQPTTTLSTEAGIAPEATTETSNTAETTETSEATGSAPEVEAGSASVATDIEATSSALAFSDVANDRWSKPFIDELSKRELISGFPDGTFAPDRPVTRAELAAQIQKIFERDTNLRDTIAFTDVDAEYWGRAAIDKSVKIGFLNGYPKAIFAPDRSVSRLEVAIALATGLGLTPSEEPNAVLAVFSDARDIPAWAKPKLAAAVQAGFAVIEPNRQAFDPSAPATREVVATMMYQALVWAQQVEPIPSDRILRP